MSLANSFNQWSANMKQNMSMLDRVVRLLIAIIIGGLYLTSQISGTVGLVLIIIAVIFLLTAVIGFCPLYSLFKLSTKKN